MVMSWISKLFQKKKEAKLPRSSSNAGVMTRRHLAVQAARAEGKKNALR